MLWRHAAMDRGPFRMHNRRMEACAKGGECHISGRLRFCTNAEGTFVAFRSLRGCMIARGPLASEPFNLMARKEPFYAPDS